MDERALWSRIERIFHSALALKGAERANYLQTACEGEEDLRRRVESLVAHDDAGSSASVGALTGNRLGPYEILAPLGAGGMGEVYRALDTKLGRDVAIKVLPEAFAHDAERMARFDREAHVLALLNHPNIAAIYGLEESSDVRALVMELVKGPTLADRIAQGPVPLDEALGLAKQIAEGLEYAHERGVIHRDLKPANIKLTSDGTIKLLDFGLAKAVGEPSPHVNPSISPRLTLQGSHAGMILGTAAYMAPEQARGAVVDRRADIWAFGVVLYEMLTGKQPFARTTVSDTLAAVLKTEPKWDAIPVEMQWLVRRCLKKNVKERLRDIGEARIALGETGRVEAIAQPPPKRLLAWAIATLALMLLAAIWVQWRATRPTGQRLVRLSVELPAFAPSGGASAVLSPDGTRVVYTGRGPNGSWRLYTRTLDQEQVAPLAGTEDGETAFFSPDGQSVGFFAGGKLKKISVAGGGPTVLCDAPQEVGGNWSEDGSIVAALNRNSVVSRIPSGGGAAQPLTEFKGDEVTHRWPQMLPGAQAVLFTAHTYNRDFDAATIKAQPLPMGEAKTLVRGGYFGRYVPSGHLLYVRQGTLFAAPMDVRRLELTGPAVPVIEGLANNATIGYAQMDYSRTGTLLYMTGEAEKQLLVWLDSAGHVQPIRVTAAEYEGAGRFSPDGKRLAFSVSAGGNFDVSVYEWERDSSTRLTWEPGVDGYPVWLPDGKHVVFNSTKHGGAPNLYWMRADGAGESVRLMESKNIQVPYSLSPDGKRLAFSEIRPQTRADLWILPLEDVESDHPRVGKAEPFLATPFYEDGPAISPDGRWLAYYSDESGSFQVYVRRFQGPGGKWQISTSGGRWPIWSKKRQELFYGSSEGMIVTSYAVNGEAFVIGKPRLWAAIKDLNLGPFDLAPDGKRFAVLQPEAADQKGKTHVTFLLNFFDELRRSAPPGGK